MVYKKSCNMVYFCPQKRLILLLHLFGIYKIYYFIVRQAAITQDHRPCIRILIFLQNLGKVLKIQSLSTEYTSNEHFATLFPLYIFIYSVFIYFLWCDILNIVILKDFFSIFLFLKQLSEDFLLTVCLISSLCISFNTQNE